MKSIDYFNFFFVNDCYNENIKRHHMIRKNESPQFQILIGKSINLDLVAYLSSYREKAINALYTSSLKSCQPSVSHTNMGEFQQVLFPTAQQVNLPACFPHRLLNAKRQAGKL